MVGDGFEGWTPLKDLPPSEKVYQSVDGDGRVWLRTSLVHYDNRKAFAVTERHLVALALTEVCCEQGKGKVYYFPMPTQAQLDGIPSGSTRSVVVYSFHQLPKLIYVPIVWAEKDKEEWRATRHSDRLEMLNARAGGLARKDIVMPIDLIYDQLEKKTIRVNGYTAEDKGCLATIAIVPKAYLGWVPDFHKGCLRFESAAQGFELGLAWYVTNHEILQKNGCAQDDLQAMVKKLRGMYFEGRKRSLIHFEDLLKVMIDFHKRWSDAGGS